MKEEFALCMNTMASGVRKTYTGGQSTLQWPAQLILPKNKHNPELYSQGSRLCELKDDPKKYYVEMDFILELLRSRAVVLIRGQWLRKLSAQRPFLPLPCRQRLPFEAMFPDPRQDPERELEELLTKGTCRKKIVSISRCSLTANHLDPDGLLLKELVCVSDIFYGREDVLFFFAGCSIHQIYHDSTSPTQEQENLFQKASQSVDIWYTHHKTQVWMLTKVLGNEQPYKERGWPSWERTVSEIFTQEPHLLNLGRLLLPEQKLDCQTLRDLCTASREPQQFPEKYDKLIDQKHFTRGVQGKQLIKESYRPDCCEALVGAWKLRLEGLRWGDEQTQQLALVLTLCAHLQELWLPRKQIGDAGARSLAAHLQNCTILEQLGLDSNRIGDDGAITLAKHLEQNCRSLQGLHLPANHVGHDGMHALN
eukprot:TRINITY_DN23436_c0_g1_i1.p1 TRINITY_DN23436_c0_g1~~TRINITY_DN23436_c0_g1_i1.p1  ORF type:complete len:423 (+),score=59.11 TRINITY_DN23436_c0_g1_i1:222-1490(+)